MNEPTNQDVLTCPMGENDASAATVGDYLITLLAKLWDEEEGFDGKRPFGNSSWTYDLYAALGRAGLVKIQFDEDGYVDRFTDDNRRSADRMIAEAIRSLRYW